MRRSYAALGAIALLAGCQALQRLASTPVTPTERTAAYRFGRLVDGSGQAIVDAVVVTRGERIVSVTAGDAGIPAGATVVDLRKYTAIPGMIDVHTHMTYYWTRDPGTQPNRQPRRTIAETVFLAQENARKTLETGVTTARDLGAQGYADVSMRNLINRGAMLGPRMFVAGYGLTKVNTPPNPNAPPGFPRGRIANISEIDGAIKIQIDSGADVIKMYGSLGSFQNVTTTQTFNYDEMKAAVDAAHKYGKLIAIHSYGPEGGRDAVRAGANTVEHPVDLDEETLREMARKNIIYVPTVDHNRYYAEYRNEYGWTAEQGAALDAYRARNFETVRRAIRANVKIAMGSDAVYSMFGQNTRELGHLVQAGMTPAQALASATTIGAEALGMADRLGKVAPGYFADIVAVEGDPLADINVLFSGIKVVIKGGKILVDKR